MLTSILLFALTSHAALVQAPAEQVPEIRWDPAPFIGEYRDRSGAQELAGRLGRITVPENRAKGTGGTVEVAFVVYKTENKAPLAPMVYLVGGPGGAGTEFGASFAKHPLLAVLDYCDVIAVDQRGTGLSLPNLSAGPDLTYTLPLDQPLTQAAEEEAFAAAAARGYAYWTREGVDLAAFNTEESAEDIDDVRRALGLEKITLWGGSYGSHLGLAYLRRHSDHVERAVLQKVEGPDHTLKLPSTVQRHLEQLSAMVAADKSIGAAMPDLLGLTRELIARLDKAPVKVSIERGGAPVEVTVGAFDLQRELALSLGSIRDLAQVPARLYAMSNGDWSELAAAALESRYGDVGSMMTVMMDMSSGASPKRRAQIEREAADARNLLGDTINAPFGALVRKAVGDPDLGDSFRAPIQSDVLVVFLTGRLDVRTPPENVAELRAGFPNHVYLDVTGVSHDSFEMLSRDYQRVMKSFLSGEPVESQVIHIDEMKFRPLPSVK
ncbi:MAG: alpha/beta fold hydrolase [Planctomycetota bacterium]